MYMYSYIEHRVSIFPSYETLLGHTEGESKNISFTWKQLYLHESFIVFRQISNIPVSDTSTCLKGLK